MNAGPSNNALIAKARAEWTKLSGAVLSFFVLSGFILWAAPPLRPVVPHLPTMTNASYAHPAMPLPTSTSVSPAEITNAMDALDDKHTLAIGDVLSFQIMEDEDDPRTIIVTDSGDLEVPYIGRFPAENRTCRQLARELKAALEKEYYYQATVIIAVNTMTKSRGKVYLVGAVRNPGPEDLPSDEVLTSSKAILRAGGFNEFADRKHVKITREDGAGKADKVTLVVDVGQIFDEGKTEKDVPLKSGDLIYIPERLVRF
jgi:polysaccharide export outer membrane protein